MDKYLQNINIFSISTVELIDSSLLFTKIAINSSPLDTYEKVFSSDHRTKDLYVSIIFILSEKEKISYLEREGKL